MNGPEITETEYSLPFNGEEMIVVDENTIKLGDRKINLWGEQNETNSLRS